MPRLLLLVAVFACASVVRAADPIDFNRDVRPILSNNCFACHGPDEKTRKAKLRLDTFDGATKSAAVVPGKPESSELIKRVTTRDETDLMPPAKSGKKLTAKEVETLKAWIAQGGQYAQHWSYVKPFRPPVPKGAANPIDAFLLARLAKEGLKPSPQADRTALIRRVALDLTGLPPTLEEVDTFLKDESKDAYEKMVDRMLAKPAFGEHWARLWLDLARYADSAGYADDPPRTIWAYRDYVIKAFNANKPFDRFTVEQLAGDLLPDATDETRVATAFHRNTMTNNEGGTSDEEFRNAAIVDRVNTTMAVWMGTSAACAQCHTHKYDPISQAEYFKLFAFLNNTEDADRTDETPVLPLFTDEQKKQRAAWEAEVTTLKAKLKSPPAEVLAKLPAWEKAFPRGVTWQTPKPNFRSGKDQTATIVSDEIVLVPKSSGTDTYSVELPLTVESLTAVRLETVVSRAFNGAGHAGGNFVINKISASVLPPAATAPTGRYLRVELPGKNRHLMLAEVQAFSGNTNVAPKGTASQSSVAYEGEAKRAVDGETNGNYFEKNSVTHTKDQDDPWWEVDLKEARAIDKVVIWNRTDGGVGSHLTNFRVKLLDDKRNAVWEEAVADAPNPSREWKPNGSRGVKFTQAVADYSQPDFDASLVINNPQPRQRGWAVGGAVDKSHTLTLIPDAAVKVAKGSKLVVTIEQTTTHKDHTLGSFRLGYSADAGAATVARTPADVLAVLNTPAEKRSDEQKAKLTEHYLTVAPEMQADRDRLAAVTRSLADLKPATTVPVLKELPQDRRRVTKIQSRGNFMVLGDTVTEGTPVALHPLPKGEPVNRLGFAKWVVSPDNPLTARVTVNRFWEQIFGTGLVRTTEEFGVQGELPSHPELLDWLAVEFQQKWDVKALLRLMVTSDAYKQSSKVTPELRERDPDNRLYARGPRHRLSAEMIRDQALAVSGLLSGKMFGPSVRPPRPSAGLSAAFGGGLDWATSAGEDKHRRGIYTEWRRTSPYPSMVTFDAPSREACTLRRIRTNTPLQALVTLNDPVYVEAAQALARKTAAAGKTTEERAAFAFRTCTSRPPTDKELARLVKLFEESKAEFAKDPKKAEAMATDPIGPLPKDGNAVELAAWTTVANVLLNLDEMLMRR